MRTELSWTGLVHFLYKRPLSAPSPPPPREGSKVKRHPLCTRNWASPDAKPAGIIPWSWTFQLAELWHINIYKLAELWDINVCCLGHLVYCTFGKVACTIQACQESISPNITWIVTLESQLNNIQLIISSTVPESMLSKFHPSISKVISSPISIVFPQIRLLMSLLFLQLLYFIFLQPLIYFFWGVFHNSYYV